MSPAYFNAEHGVLDPSVFSRPGVYRDELERLFARHWLFVGPAGWAETQGDYFTSSMGETPVLVWRGAEGVRVFVNRCLGSDQLLTESDRGAAERLPCPCHGWLYAPDPADDAAAPEAAPLTDTYRGLLFACFDPEAPPLKTSLGEFAFYLDMIADSLPGGLEIHGDAPLRTHMPANWKLAAEAYSGDTYRDLTLTRATRDVLGDAPLTAATGLQAATDAGAIVLAEAADDSGTGPSGLRPLMATLFPNLSFDGRGHALHVWRPRGPLATEVATYCIVGRDEPDAVKASRRRSCQLRFGPMGLETQDHEAVWASVTRASKGLISRGRPLNLQMGLGRERRTNLPGRIDDLVSENNQRQFYSWWQAALARPPSPRKSRSTLSILPPGGGGARPAS